MILSAWAFLEAFVWGGRPFPFLFSKTLVALGIDLSDCVLKKLNKLNKHSTVFNKFRNELIFKGEKSVDTGTVLF